MALLTQVEAIRAARITGTPTADQVLTITDMINALTPALENEAGPIELGTRVWTVQCTARQRIVLPYRFNSIISVVMDGVTIPPAQYDGVTDADRGILREQAFYWPIWFYGVSLVVTVSVGSVTIAANVKEAAMELFRYWWQATQQSPGPASEGSAPWMAGALAGALPPRVAGLLRQTPELGGFA